MKSIKQLSAEWGISKQAVNKWVAKLPPNLVTTDNSGKKLINADGEALLQEMRQPTETPPKATTFHQPPTDEVVFLRERILSLETELNREREHSREIAVQLSELARNAQKLHGADMIPRITESAANGDGGTVDTPKPWYKKLLRRNNI